MSVHVPIPTVITSIRNDFGQSRAARQLRQTQPSKQDAPHPHYPIRLSPTLLVFARTKPHRDSPRTSSVHQGLHSKEKGSRRTKIGLPQRESDVFVGWLWMLPFLTSQLHLFEYLTYMTPCCMCNVLIACHHLPEQSETVTSLKTFARLYATVARGASIGQRGVFQYRQAPDLCTVP